MDELNYPPSDRISKTDGHRNVLKKHAAAIHATNPPLLLQRKIFNVLLSHAKDSLLTEEEHFIKISDIASSIGYNGNNYNSIKNSLRGLVRFYVEWNIINDDAINKEECWVASTFLAGVRIKEGICYYSYSPQLKKFLHTPSIYGRINLTTQAKFSSMYGLALYENCVRYQSLPATRWFDLEEFRKLMGTPPEKYIIFRDFKRRVIDAAIEEVNLYSEINISSEYVKISGIIKKIRFLIHKKQVNTAVISTINCFQNTVEEGDDPEEVCIHILVNKFKLSQNKAKSLLQQHDLEYIRQKIKLVENSTSYKTGQIKNVAAYFLDALKNDYQTPRPSNNLIDQRMASEKMALKIKEEKLQKEANENIQYSNYIKKNYLEVVQNLPVDAKESLIEEFFEHKKMATLLKRYYLESGVGHPLIWPLFEQFCNSQYKYLFSHLNLMKIEDFLRSLLE